MEFPARSASMLLCTTETRVKDHRANKRSTCFHDAVS